MGEWLHQSLSGGWHALRRDPIGILLPASGALLLHAGGAIGLRAWWDDLSWTEIGGAVLAFQVARVLIAAPFRAPMIAAGARALDHPATGLPRAVALVVVDLLVGAATVVAGALLVVPASFLSALLAARGLYLFAAVVFAIGTILAALLVLLVRSCFAYAPAFVVVRRQGPFEALGDAWRTGAGDRVQLAAILLLGDVLVAGGGALCAAGALPSWPIADLAVLHRWTRRVAPTAVGG